MQRLVWWVQWHRRLGAVVAVLVCMLAVTGILINHSQDMGWHRKPVFSTVLAWLYVGLLWWAGAEILLWLSQRLPGGWL